MIKLIVSGFFLSISSFIYSQSDTNIITDAGVNTIKQNNLQPLETTSTIVLPLNISLKDIEGQINKSLPTLVYEDDSYANNNNDNFKCKVWKKADVNVSHLDNNELNIDVPLKVWVEKGYGIFGLMKYQSTEFELILKFKTKFTLTADWRIKTTTLPNGLTWITKPTLDFGVINIPITPFVEKSLEKKHPDFAKKIDEECNKNMNLKPYAIQAWNFFAQPYLASETYNTWLRIIPIKIEMTPLVIQNGNLTATLALGVIAESFTGKKPLAATPVVDIADLLFTNTIPNELFSLNTTANIDYPFATKMAKEQFLNKKYAFKEGKYNVEILDMEVYNDLDKIIIKTLIKGDINGTILVKGIPVYDAVKKKIVLTNTDFDLKTRNLFHKTAAWLFESKIEKMIEQDYGIPVDELMKYTQNSINQALNKEYYKGVAMKGSVLDITPKNININNNGIVAMVNTTASVSLIISGFNK